MLNGLFRVDTNKLACQMCLLWVTRVDPLRVTWVDPFMTYFLSCHFKVNSFMTQTH